MAVKQKQLIKKYV